MTKPRDDLRRPRLWSVLTPRTRTRTDARSLRLLIGRLAIVTLVLAAGLQAGGVVAAQARTASKHTRRTRARTHRTRKRGKRRTTRKRARVPGHIQTWAFDDGCNGGSGASAALVRGWLSFAETNCGPAAAKARNDCHHAGRVFCKVMQYLDTDWISKYGAINATTAAFGNWWLHEPAPNQNLIISGPPGAGSEAIDQSQPAVRSFFSSYVREHYNSDDGLFMDDQGTSLSQFLFYSSCGCSSTSEIRTNRQLVAAHEAMSAALRHRNGAPFEQVDNALPPNPFLPEGFEMLNRATGVDALAGDGLPVRNGVIDPYYSTLLDQIAFADTRTRAALLLIGEGQAGTPYEDQGRRIQEATMLLGYRQGHLIDAAELEQNSRDLAVWPEEAIYPTRPLETMRAPRGRGCLGGTGGVCTRGGHTNLQVARGVYRRVFAACYRGRVAIGPCAAIVNTTDHPVAVRGAWLRRRFRHQITFSGGDVQSGGSLRLAGAPFVAGRTAVAPGDAMLLSR